MTGKCWPKCLGLEIRFLRASFAFLSFCMIFLKYLSFFAKNFYCFVFFSYLRRTSSFSFVSSCSALFLFQLAFLLFFCLSLEIFLKVMHAIIFTDKFRFSFPWIHFQQQINFYIICAMLVVFLCKWIACSVVKARASQFLKTFLVLFWYCNK